MTEEFQIINSIQGLQDLRIHLERIAVAWSLSKRQLFEVNLIIEEICVNFIEHVESNTPSYIGVKLILEESTLSIVITDEGPEFDPTAIPTPDLSLAINERKVGGLGLYFVKHYSDSISYKRIRNTNNLFIEKKLE